MKYKIMISLMDYPSSFYGRRGYKYKIIQEYYLFYIRKHAHWLLLPQQASVILEKTSSSPL